MIFYGHGFSRIISGSCFRVTFISGNENHKLYNNFSFIFSIFIKLFYGLEEELFEIFGKLQERNSVMGSIFCHAAALRS